MYNILKSLVCYLQLIFFYNFHCKYFRNHSLDITYKSYIIYDFGVKEDFILYAKLNMDTKNENSLFKKNNQLSQINVQNSLGADCVPIRPLIEIVQPCVHFSKRARALSSYSSYLCCTRWQQVDNSPYRMFTCLRRTTMLRTVMFKLTPKRAQSL
jgi:hypothetical protein